MPRATPRAAVICRAAAAAGRQLDTSSANLDRMGTEQGRATRLLSEELMNTMLVSNGYSVVTKGAFTQRRAPRS